MWRQDGRQFSKWKKKIKWNFHFIILVIGREFNKKNKKFLDSVNIGIEIGLWYWCLCDERNILLWPKKTSFFLLHISLPYYIHTTQYIFIYILIYSIRSCTIYKFKKKTLYIRFMSEEKENASLGFVVAHATFNSYIFVIINQKTIMFFPFVFVWFFYEKKRH